MTVSGEEVGAPVLVLVADLESGAVLGLARVIGAHQLTREFIEFSNKEFTFNLNAKQEKMESSFLNQEDIAEQ